MRENRKGHIGHIKILLIAIIILAVIAVAAWGIILGFGESIVGDMELEGASEMKTAVPIQNVSKEA